MKRRATAILLGIMVSSMFLSACGKNEAKEAANESAQVEEEGVGEVTEEGEKVEAENKNASDADDSSKAGDSAKSDEDNKEISVKEEEDGDSSGKDLDDESEEDAEVTEASAGKIGVLLSDDDEDAKIDSEEMTSQIEDGGYEADVKNAGGDMLRGGAYKPRTSPYSFQGLEEEGLKYMKEAGKAFDLATICEVVSLEAIEAAVKYVDMIQIGARNMQNFILLKEAGRSGLPVLLKRGLCATIDEWLNAAEYIMAEGNPNVVLCERGIRTYETSTRNTLDLSAVPVLKERTHLPVIVDPSHATGAYRYVPPMAKAAVACGADGLMIEVHNNPACALSDGPQSLNFEKFARLSKELDPFWKLAGRN